MLIYLCISYILVCITWSGGFRVLLFCYECLTLMMGVSLCQWRYSIGTFNQKYMPKLGKINRKFHTGWSFQFGHLACLPFILLLGLVKVFAFCTMIITLLPAFLFLHPFLMFFFDKTFAFPSYNICPFTNYFAHIFSTITLLPCHITTSVRSIFSFCKK